MPFVLIPFDVIDLTWPKMLKNAEHRLTREPTEENLILLDYIRQRCRDDATNAAYKLH